VRYPDCKIVVTLRDPAERAFSLYLHHRRKGRVGDSFAEAIEEKPRIVEAGRYAQHVPRWREAFGPDQVLCVLLADVKTRPADVLWRICTFLEVKTVAPPAAGEKANAATLPRFPRLARTAASLTGKLRAMRLHRVVEWGKALGLKRVFAGGEANMPELTVEKRRELTDTYEQDIAYVENLMSRRLEAWRRPDG